jgi:uncharacterized protein
MGSGSGPAHDVALNSVLPEELRDRYQNPFVIRRVLNQSKVIAIVGLSANPRKASHFVATYLQREGYRIVPVNPGVKEVLGEQAYPELGQIPFPVDLVNVFRPAEDCLEVARQAVAIEARAFWLQLRLVNLEAGEVASRGGLDVVMDRCTKMEHGRYNGSMHLNGMNTGLITARRARRWF